MAIRDSWRRAMVLSGLVDDNPRADPDFLSRLMPGAPEADDAAGEPQMTGPPNWAPPTPALAYPPPPAPPDPITARRLDPALPTPAASPPRTTPPFEAISPPPRPTGEVSVHRVAPRSFNDAQLVADQFKRGTPIILDMQNVDSDLAKRLIGFASGLTYGLDGGMERLDGRVFLLIPPRVEIPAAQRARLAAQGSLSRT